MGFKSNGVKLGWARLNSWGRLKSGRDGLVKFGMRQAYVRKGWGLEQEGVGLGLTLGGMRPLHLFALPDP